MRVDNKYSLSSLLNDDEEGREESPSSSRQPVWSATRKERGSERDARIKRGISREQSIVVVREEENEE